MRSAESGDRNLAEPRAAFVLVALALLVITALAIHRLRDFPYPLSLIEAFRGAAEVFPATAWAALKVWFFLYLSIATLAGLLIRAAPEIGLFDAILAGAGSLWVIAFVLGNLLGPPGLFSTPVIWALLASGILWLWRNPPPIRLHRPSSGQTLAALAVGLLAVSMLPMQLASPVVPFMDVLSYPSSVQRILTFHVYLPFDNDPYGCWGPYAQTPALELLYATIALGSHTSLAVLAQSATMVPMAALMIFAAYRLGKALFDDRAGGFAALFLLSTCLLRRAQGMRGTAVDFALVGLGLAFLIDSRERRMMMALGAMMLGTAIASHAIDGGFAMIVAGSAIGLWMLERDFGRAAAGVVCLAGAIMLASPEFAIALSYPVRYPVLPLVQLAGIATIIVGASLVGRDAPARRDGALRIANIVVIALFMLAVIYRHSVEPDSLYARISENLPRLTLFCFGGLVAAIGMLWSERPLKIRCAGLAAAALMFGVAGEYADPVLKTIAHNTSSAMMVSDLRIKLWDYWCPYFLTLPAGYLFGLAYERWSRPLTVFVVLTLLIYPWHQMENPIDFDSAEHSIAELWAFNLATAAQGYWVGHRDQRWTFNADEFALISVLDSEIAAGRITTATHILHLTDTISMWSLVQFPILTGINDDPIECQHDPNNLYEGGSRVRGMNELASAIALRPPYVLEQVQPPRWLGDPPAGYERIFARGNLRLYRKLNLPVSTPAATAAPAWRWLAGALLFAAILAAAFILSREEQSRRAAEQPSSPDTRSE